MNNSIEIIFVAATITSAALIVFSLILQIVRRKQTVQRVKSVQQTNTYIKPNTFDLFTNGGPNPCDNDAKIQQTKIVGIDNNIFISSEVINEKHN